MDWKKYQIQAVVDTVLEEVGKKVEELKKKIKENLTFTKKQEELIDSCEEIKELVYKKNEIESKISELRAKVNKISNKEIGNDLFPWSISSPEYVDFQKNSFIDEIVDKKLPHVPNYEEVQRKLTLQTLSAGFDVEAWIEKFVKDLNLCEE
ncbi:hypothetical protein [Lachnospira sp.]|jgi:DNA repair exonuclease SbcCD ATPase subunit|uniref:hypothetical protein n=1 Tax=Lachnospira sp. TaxID=2049031 RepID=UPI002580E703|nr:hypothetical protein [Lachnospira sp.]